MTDGTPKGTGNSRRLKSNISAETTWEQFRAALIAGTLPIDLLFNAAGWDVVGTALNKANLLTDATAALLGLTGSATVNEALAVLSEKAWIEVKTYPGTGVFGPENPNTLTFDKLPKLVVIGATWHNDAMTPYLWGTTLFHHFNYYAETYKNIVSVSGKTMTWYANGGNDSAQFNSSGVTYTAIAIGIGG